MPQIVIKIEQFEMQSEIIKFINRKGSHYTYTTEIDNKKLKGDITNFKENTNDLAKNKTKKLLSSTQFFLDLL